MNDKEFNDRLKQTVFVIEANSFEQLELWKAYNKYGWEQMNPGCLETIGKLAGMPVAMCCQWIRFHGSVIMLIEPTSLVFDHRKLTKWRKKNCNPKWDNGAREAFCDAMNFHHVLDHVKTLSKKGKQ